MSHFTVITFNILLNINSKIKTINAGNQTLYIMNNKIAILLL